MKSCPGTPSVRIATLGKALCSGLSAALLSLLAACSVNPVTGEKELGLVSPAQEVAIGQQQYAPGQQSEGGPYVLDPALSDYVARVGEGLARHSDRPGLPYEFVVLNNDVPNAWALPGGKIAVNLGLLLALHNESELAAVLSHEIVHAAARHGAQQMEQGMLLGAGLQVIGASLQDTEYRDVILQGAGLGAALIQTRYSRDAELEADHYGMQYMAAAGYDLQGAVSLQQTFVQLAQGQHQDWLSGLFASHPPSMDRVEANRRTAAALGTTGERGEARYRAAVGGLLKDKPAYEIYDKAVQALSARKFAQAEELADQAIALRPEQSLFHEVRGMALQARGNAPAALKAYDRALAYNTRFYRHHLLRGLLRKQRGMSGDAEADLRAANALLPTAQGSYALGELALARNDRKRATELFQQVANSSSPLASAAREQLQRLAVTP